jgi:hypothetical protein
MTLTNLARPGVSPFVPEGFQAEPYPVWAADPDHPGMAKPITDRAEIARLEKLGIPLYSSLAGCVLYSGVQASAFDKPLRSEPVWNGQAVLANGFSTKGIAPCGTRANYRIVALPGDTKPRHPAQWPPVQGA